MYSKVTILMEKRHNVTCMYRIITTEFNRTISLTGNHLIYTRKHSSDKFIPM